MERSLSLHLNYKFVNISKNNIAKVIIFNVTLRVLHKHTVRLLRSLVKDLQSIIIYIKENARC